MEPKPIKQPYVRPPQDLRDYFAGQALTGIIVIAGDDGYEFNSVAVEAYGMAEAMLDRRRQLIRQEKQS